MKKKSFCLLIAIMIAFSLFPLIINSTNVDASDLQDSANIGVEFDMTNDSAFFQNDDGVVSHGGADARRVAVGSSAFIAKIQARKGVDDLFLRTELNGWDRQVEISTDNTTYVPILNKNLGEYYLETDNTKPGFVNGIMAHGNKVTDTNQDRSVYILNLKRFLSATAATDIYVRFSTFGEQNTNEVFSLKFYRPVNANLTSTNMIDIVDTRDMNKLLDKRGNVSPTGEGMLGEGYNFFLYRMVIPADASEAFMVVENCQDNRQLTLIQENGSAPKVIGTKDLDANEGGLYKLNSNQWGEGQVFHNLSQYIVPGKEVGLVFKFDSKVWGGGSGSLLKKLQFHYNKELSTTSSISNRGVEDIYNVFELKRDSKLEASPIFVEDSGNVNSPESNIFYDNNNKSILKFDYAANALKAVLRVKLRGFYRLSVSTDNSTYSDIATGKIATANGTGPAQSSAFFDVTPFIEQTAGTLYVRFSDASTFDGNGPKWEKISLDISYGDNPLTFTGNEVVVDLSDDGLLQDKFGAVYHSDGAHRFADADNFFTYSVSVPSTTQHLFVAAKVGGSNRSIAASNDGSTWTDVTDAAVKVGELSYFDLNTFIKSTGDTLVSVRFGAKNTSQGNGADVNSVKFVKNTEFSTVIPVPNVIEFGVGETEKSANVAELDKIFEIDGTGEGPTSWGHHRFADGNSFFTYFVKFQPESENVFLSVDLRGSNRLLSVSTDNTTWTQISYVGIDDNDVLYGADLVDGDRSYFKLDDYLDSNNRLYIRFGAKNTSQGNGSDVYGDVKFLVDAVLTSDTPIIILDKQMKRNVNISDSSILFANSGSVLERVNNTLTRKANNTSYFTYKMQFPANTEFAYLMIRHSGENKYIQISTNGTTYTDLSYAGLLGDDKDGANYRNGDRYYYALNKYLTKGAVTDIYIKFAAKDTTKSGISLNELIVYYNKPFDAAVTYPVNPEVEEVTMVSGEGEVGFFQAALSNTSYVGNFDGDGFRFYDASTYGVYKFNYTSNPQVLKLVLEVRGGYYVSISTDGKNWTDILMSGIDYAREAAPLQNRNYFDFNISSFINDGKAIYVKVGDNTDYHGWGGAISRISLMAVSAKSGTVEKSPVFKDGQLSTQIKLYDFSLLDSNNSSTLELLGRGVKGATAHFTYKFALPADATSFFIAMNLKNMVKVEVSSDGTTFAAIPDSKLLNSEVGKGSAVTYNLGYMLDSSKTVYVRFMDGNAIDDYTGIVLSLYAGYNKASLNATGKIYANEKHTSFIVGDEAEQDFLFVNETYNVENRWEYKEIKKNAKLVYEFSYGENLKALKLKVSVGGTFKISVSKDGVSFTDVLVSTSQYYGVYDFFATVDTYNIDITSFMAGNTGKKVYIKVSDPVEDNDFGAQLVGLGIVEMTGDEVINNNGNGEENNDGCKSSFSSDQSMLGFVIVLFALGISFSLSRKNKKKGLN